MKKENPALKPGKIFRKPIKEKAFEKRYLKHITQTDDRAFLSSCFERSDGAYRFKGGLDKAGAKRLKGLAKAIKANRGFLNPAPLAMIGVLAALIVVFGLFFMNPLLEKTAEAGLSSAFQARAEISGFRLNPFGLGISMRSLAIADRDAPMSNLIEFGVIRLKLDPAAALKLKVHIEEARADRIAFGTPRKTSGALPEYPAKQKDEAAKAEAPPMVDFAAFDAKAILEREKDNLASTKAYDEVKAAYERIETEWKARVDSSKKTVDDLKASSERLRNLDPKKVRTIDEARTAISDIKTMKASVSSAVDAAKGVSGGIKKDFDAAVALEKAAKASFDKDRAYLRSLVDPKSGAAFAALEPAIRAMLSDSSEKYLNYGLRGLEVLEGLKAKGKKSPKDAARKSAGDKKEKPNPKGRDYLYPTRGYPAFWLGRLDSSFNENSRDWVISLADVSTEPDLVGAPTKLGLGVSAPAFGVEAAASADLRSDANGAYDLDLKGRGLPVDLKEGMDRAGLDGFSGTGSGSLKAAGRSGGAMELSADIKVSEAMVSGARGTIGLAIAEGVKKLGSVEATVSYAKAAGGADSFKLRTNLDKIVSGMVAAVAGQYAKKALAELDGVMKSYGGEKLSSALGSKGGAEGLLKDAMSGEKGAGDMQTVLDRKTAALEARIKELGAGALKGLKLPGL